MSPIICGIVLLSLWEVDRDLFGETKIKTDELRAEETDF